MKSPQTEDGYTRIANELLVAFSQFDASGSAWRVFMVILRKTYGFHKKEDRISLTQFGEMSKLSRMSVCRGINELLEKNAITVKRVGYINTYSIQKNYELWGSIKPVTSNKYDTKSSIKPVTKTSNKYDTYKRKKDNKDISGNEFPVIIGNNRNNMGWKDKRSENDEDLPAIDMDSRQEIETDESKADRELKELNVKIRANLKIIEPLRGIPWGVGKDMNFQVKIYRELLNAGHSHAGIISTFMEIVDTPHWKEKKKQGEYPGINTVQFYVRNKKPI